MEKKNNSRGFTLIEVVVAVAVFLIFSVGIYSTTAIIFKTVYQSRLHILETAALTEQMEIVKNLDYDDVGTVNGVPTGILLAEQTFDRDSVSLFVTTTVRNIDDPFDGTINTNPVDDSPADYKLVEMSAICLTCGQRSAIVLSTIVVPKSLESASNNGSILVRAIDANGQPISGANVNITNTTVSPIININDITDGQGYLEVVDTPTGTLSYNISVTKSDNYSTDFTTSSSATNPNPSKLPITVESKKSATATFQIDQLGSINIHSVSKTDCSGIGGVGINARGQKLIGVLPVVYKYSRNITTDGNGDYALANMEWDSYFLTLTGSVYDIAGTIPMLPAQLLPGGTQDVSLILSNHTANSLLVKVKDAGTGLPLSGVPVRLTGVRYDNSLKT